MLLRLFWLEFLIFFLAVFSPSTFLSHQSMNICVFLLPFQKAIKKVCSISGFRSFGLSALLGIWTKCNPKTTEGSEAEWWHVSAVGWIVSPTTKAHVVACLCDCHSCVVRRQWGWRDFINWDFEDEGGGGGRKRGLGRGRGKKKEKEKDEGKFACPALVNTPEDRGCTPGVLLDNCTLCLDFQHLRTGGINALHLIHPVSVLLEMWKWLFS